MADHETSEGPRMVDATAEDAVEQARRLHHLATADPERDGTLTGAAHEEKYGLDRAEHSAELWRAVGVHPIENRALRPGEEGYVDPNGEPESASQKSATQNTASNRASK